jgi:allene oxide cyclase
MRRIFPYIGIAAVAAFAATAVTAVAGSHGRGHGTPHVRTVTVVEHPDTDTQIFITNPTTKVDAVGDQLPFANPIFDKADKKKVGSDQGNCVRVVAGVSWECNWTTFLPKGQITVEGPFLDSGAATKLAITGGTGSYAKVRGYMVLRANAKDPKKFDFVFHLDDR